MFVPHLFLLGHSVGAENFDEISRIARLLLIFVAAYCLFDTVQIIFVGAIKGAGDTSFVVITSLICSFLFVAFGLVGYMLFDSDLPLLYWWWWALTGWLVLLSIVFGTRFIKGKWRTMQVIEKELIPAVQPSSDP